ncbi:hypothetical protein FFF34_006235 [Inquilinus sp. KBS0705]|nr:hypothetical protein FFF34_006235 [Inquilinus sp. KBS0705]
MIMSVFNKILIINIACLICLNIPSFAQTKNVKVGAYYFDGWTGTYPYHITDKLKNTYSERKPIWGWITSSQKIVDKQILAASQSGLSFFSFCWYNDVKDTATPLNNALSYYLKSPYQDKLKFCLMIANHKGNEVRERDWDKLTTEWIKLFKSKNYLTVNNKPLIIFFTPKGLNEEFGSFINVKQAFDKFRQKAIACGLKGVTIAACVGSNGVDIASAKLCGYDVLTGYNYHYAGFTGSEKVVPIEKLQQNETKEWNKISGNKLPYIPVSTLNWDPRPWADQNQSYANSPRYTGFSTNSVYKSVANICKWVNTHPNNTPKERIALLYAWNEYGEGAWLTPSKTTDFLPAIKQANNQ